MTKTELFLSLNLAGLPIRLLAVIGSPLEFVGMIDEADSAPNNATLRQLVKKVCQQLDISGIPEVLIPDIGIKSLSYSPQTGTLIVSDASIDGEPKFSFFLVTKSTATSNSAGNGKSGFVLGLNFHSPLSLYEGISPDNPIRGFFDQSISLSNVSVFYSTVDYAAFDKPTVPSMQSPSVDGGQAKSSTISIRQGLSIVLSINSGTTHQELALSLSNEQKPAAVTASQDAPPLPATGAGNSAPGSAGQEKWFSIQKAFGPLYIERIGAGWKDGKLELLLDASITLLGLGVTLSGFSVSFPLSIFTDPSLSKLSIGLNGLALTYEAGLAEISGGFLIAGNEYSGEALIAAESFTLFAIGSYGTINGHPSLFIFALLEAAIGGPPFFSVTGVAAGFGLNRTLNIPTLDQLPTFPLVAAAMAGETGNNPFSKPKDPGASLLVLHDWIPPEQGAIWLAVGIRFTSFEMINSFALLTVTFGCTFELALLGLSTITIPTGAPEPIGFAELALKATFSPESGLLAVSSKLTPESYILSNACHLTGGFAFYIWFKDSSDGASAGDFVISLGGYHPHFPVPSYYPVEPRLGVNWQISDNLIIKGGIYFALTPSAVMAGGYWEASWQSGDLKAWFTADINFLLSWKPFHYQANLDLSLGASYTIDLQLTSNTVTVHVGVGLEIWGPSFAGRAYVDLYVVTFTISFGDSSPSVEPIEWSEFKSSFLPEPGTPVAGKPTEILTDTYCLARVSGGLIKDLSTNKQNQDDLDWVINPELFAMVTQSLIPCNQASLTTGGGSSNPSSKKTELTGTWTKDGFGVGPVGVSNGSLDSHHSITIYKLEGGSPDLAYDVLTTIQTNPVLTNVPKATWDKNTALNPSIDTQNAAPTIPNVLSGFTLSPVVKPPDHTLPIDIALLQETLDDTMPTFDWAIPELPSTDTFDQSNPISVLMSSINSDAIATRRAGILDALLTQGVDINTRVDVSRLAASAKDVLQDGPVLSALGEERNA